MFKILVDTQGSDKGPKTIISGVRASLEKNANLEVVLVGDKSVVEAECRELNLPMERVEIIDAPDTITNYDSPATALFEKPNSSLVRSLQALAEREDIVGMLNAGSTGALIAGSMRFLSGKERVRPSLAGVLPNEQGAFTCLADTGATIDCTASMLVHFARMGSDLMKRMYRIDNPRVGLLSNGAEETKGNKLVKEAHALLKEATDINFIGNVEGNKALSGVCDVLVCDGFAGNQVLKVTEGTATRLITDIAKYGMRTNSADIMELVKHLMGLYDISSLGGGIILGACKPVVKAHGCADEKAIISTLQMLLNMAQNVEVFDKEQCKL